MHPLVVGELACGNLRARAEVLGLLRADPLTAHIPVIALSANALPRDVRKGLDAGFLRYLTKPINVPEFMEALDTALSLTAAT